MSGRKSAGSGSDCRSSGTSTFPLTQAFQSGAGKRCRTRNQLDPGPTPLSPKPRPKLEPRPPRALPAQEPSAPPGPASRVLRPSPLYPLTQSLTARLRTVSPKVRKLHRRAGRGPAGRGRDAELPKGSSSGSKSRPRTLGGTPRPAPSSPRLRPLYRSVSASRTAVLTPPLARAGALTSSRRAGTSRSVCGGGAHPGRAEARPSCFARRRGAGWCLLGYRVAAGGFGDPGSGPRSTKALGRAKTRRDYIFEAGVVWGLSQLGPSPASHSAPSPSHFVYSRCYTYSTN